ncbi:hypothetical protein Tco_0189921 [Tanacetum coccineum]
MILRLMLEDSRSWQLYVQLWYQILRNLWKSSSGDCLEVLKISIIASKPQTLEEAITITQRTLHCQVSDLQQGGSSDQELQKQRANYWKQSTTSVNHLSCMWRERALHKLVPEGKQQYLRKSILAERQERSPRRT